MNLAQTSKIVGILALAYPRWKSEISDTLEETIQLWQSILENLEYSLCVKITHHIIANSKYSPTIADFLNVLREYDESSQPSANELLAQITNAIRKYGYCQEKSALSSMSEISRQVAESFGWQEICASEEPGVTRGILKKLIDAQIQKHAERRKFSNMPTLPECEIKMLD